MCLETLAPKFHLDSLSGATKVEYTPGIEAVGVQFECCNFQYANIDRVCSKHVKILKDHRNLCIRESASLKCLKQCLTTALKTIIANDGRIVIYYLQIQEASFLTKLCFRGEGQNGRALFKKKVVFCPGTLSCLSESSLRILEAWDSVSQASSRTPRTRCSL